MCRECLQAKCPSGCPNAPLPKEVYRCKHCGDDIVEGDTYYQIGSKTYCTGCVEENIAELEVEERDYEIT